MLRDSIWCHLPSATLNNSPSCDSFNYQLNCCPAKFWYCPSSVSICNCSTCMGTMLLFHTFITKLPTASALSPAIDYVTVNLADYKTGVAIWTLTAWESAKNVIFVRLETAEILSNKQAKDLNISTGDTVFVYFPVKKYDRAFEFVRLFQGSCGGSVWQGNASEKSWLA